MNDSTHDLRIRPGGPDDAPVILDMLDAAVAWMNSRGNTEQWGTVPYSRTSGGVERVRRYTTEYAPYIAELDGTPVGTLVLDSGPSPQMPMIKPADEPERYVRLLVSDRRNSRPGHRGGAPVPCRRGDQAGGRLPAPGRLLGGRRR